MHAKRTIINVYAKKDVMVLPDKVATSAGPKEVTLGFVDISNDSVPYAMKDCLLAVTSVRMLHTSRRRMQAFCDMRNLSDFS